MSLLARCPRRLIVPSPPRVVNSSLVRNATTGNYPEGDSYAYRLSKKTIIRGFDPKKEVLVPMTSFDSVPFDDRIKEVFRSRRYREPTTAQAQMWPAIMSGLDTVMIAKTGTGKTVGYLSAIYQRLLNDAKKKATATQTQKSNPALNSKALQSPEVVIIAPKRDLVCDIEEEAHTLGRSCGFTATAVCGGPSKEDLIKMLKESPKVNVLVATPPRLRIFIEEGLIDLSRVRYVVLDEGHVLLNIKMKTETKKILKALPTNKFMTVAVGARWNQLARDYEPQLLRRNYKFFQIVRDKVDMDGEPTDRAIKTAYPPSRKRRMIRRRKERQEKRDQEARIAAEQALLPASASANA
jgi:superfamily II DNA/RNA helicase